MAARVTKVSLLDSISREIRILLDAGLTSEDWCEIREGLETTKGWRRFRLVRALFALGEVKRTVRIVVRRNVFDRSMRFVVRTYRTDREAHDRVMHETVCNGGGGSFYEVERLG